LRPLPDAIEAWAVALDEIFEELQERMGHSIEAQKGHSW
jgi:hypothetical protein